MSQIEDVMNAKILLIDDEAEIRTLLTDLLEEEGYEVCQAKDGNNGLEVFQARNPDLVITDVRMPKKNGIELLKNIQDSASEVDVIILTGQSDEATAIECLKAGAYDYLLKPVEDVELLLTAVSRALQKRHLEKQNKLLIKQLEDLVVRDPLTGLLNVRQLYTYLDEEISRSARYNHEFCLLFMDIDYFKKVNDTYGHQFGDYVLQNIGRIMKSVLRSTNRLFRYGGEEFVAVLPETSRDEAISIIDRLMESIRSHCFQNEEHATNITVSIGGAIYPTHASRKKDLIKFADQALYQAKQLGRNRFIFKDI